MAALRVGADLSHVFCTRDAGAPIKSYSPDLIVHPVLPDSSTGSVDDAEKVIKWFPALHALVVGPGLGRDSVTLDATARILKAARKAGLPVVMDGDALFLANQQPDLIQNWKELVLTPNLPEMNRLLKQANVSQGTRDKSKVDHQLMSYLQGAHVLQKGAVDYIIGPQGEQDHRKCQEEGAKKRVGGQGDLLAGTVGVFLIWAKQNNGSTSDALWAASTLIRR